MKILLICAAGMSTSLVVAKMKEVAKADGKKYEIEAVPVQDGFAIANDWDVALFGPQLRYRLPEFKKKFPNVPADSIAPQHYGSCNGQAVLAQAEGLVK